MEDNGDCSHPATVVLTKTFGGQLQVKYYSTWGHDSVMTQKFTVQSETRQVQIPSEKKIFNSKQENSNDGTHA